MKKVIICFVLSTIFLVGCSSSNDNSKDKTTDSSKISSNDTQKSDEDFNDKNTTTNNSDDSTVNSDVEESISQKVKDYILTGQGNKPEADKFKWSENFLNNVDIDSIYKEYLQSGGVKGNVESFAKYLTENAPISSDWEELFKEDFSKAYDYSIVKVEPLENELYQVYVTIDNKEVPYVVVSARTGYYHG